jgi:hypothetical protein
MSIFVTPLKCRLSIFVAVVVGATWLAVPSQSNAQLRTPGFGRLSFVAVYGHSIVLSRISSDDSAFRHQAGSPPQSQPTSTAEEWILVLKIFISFYIMCLLIGYAIGRARSPQFDDPTRSPLYIREYVARNVTTNWREIFEETTDRDALGYPVRRKSVTWKTVARTRSPLKISIDKPPVETRPVETTAYDPYTDHPLSPWYRPRYSPPSQSHIDPPPTVEPETVEPEVIHEYTASYDGATIVAIGPALCYRFVAGATVFIYDAARDLLAKEPVESEEASKHRIPRNNLKFSETMTLLIGGSVGSYSVSSVTTHMTSEVAAHNSVSSVASSVTGVVSMVAAYIIDNLKYIIAAILGTVSGLLIGIKLGYRNQPKPGEPLFLTLLNSEVFWRGVGSDHIRLFWWKLEGQKLLSDIWPTMDEGGYVTVVRAGSHVPNLTSREDDNSGRSETSAWSSKTDKGLRDLEEMVTNQRVFVAFLEGLSDRPSTEWCELKRYAREEWQLLSYRGKEVVIYGGK